MEKLITYFNTISPLKSSTWQSLLKLFTQEELEKDQYFVKVNQVADKIGFLETGVVRAFFINSEGKEYNKQFFVAQSIIGAYSSLLTGRPNLISQQALTDCVVYTCNYTDLVRLFDEHQDLERLARKIAEYYFLEKEKKELEIVLLNAKQRYSIFQNEFPTLEQLIPQYHIASYLGISAIQLSRIRSQVAKKK
ncbi:Crp/Fnr family transcriptional regulator [Lacibacter sp.]|uniref:Crp/Fnr family transcriptional regulator n=1 Tax=Lacibacter sp. TaxID=1915409 RepID=UPI002B4B23F5|nr:Crp/Fnr family transcriptional regulator [Lacibacter sp.]HLP37031.1 Crp/Fnr family transcriptional regulator [Lacibacter sp.]